MTDKKKIEEFYPFFIMLTLSIVTFFIYLFAFEEHSAVKILEVCVAPLIMLIVPLLNRLLKTRIPVITNAVIGIFTFVAINLASVLDFYGIIPYFDKAVHLFFGVVGSFVMFTILLCGGGDSMKPWCFFAMILLGVLGASALWEIYEYAASAILGSDMQHWFPDMSVDGDTIVKEFFKNYDPLWDTMWDMIMASFGVLIFYIIMIADRLRGWKMCKHLYSKITEKE